jgi:prepilin-type processing-associated H-X9-DG protein
MYTVADARACHRKEARLVQGMPLMNLRNWNLPPGVIELEAAPPHAQGYNILFADGPARHASARWSSNATPSVEVLHAVSSGWRKTAVRARLGSA